MLDPDHCPALREVGVKWCGSQSQVVRVNVHRAAECHLLCHRKRFHRHGLTVVELLVVVSIIGVLMGLVLTATGRVQQSSRMAQAAAETHRILAAVCAFQTEYGRYPVLPPTSGRPIVTDVAVGESRIGIKIPNRELFYTLCAVNEGMNEEHRINFRKVVFFDEKDVADPKHPRNGFLRQSTPEQPNGRDCLFDPWERQYCIAIDYTGEGKLKLMYGDFAGVNAPSVPVGVFSLGPDQSLGASGNECYGSGPTKSDDLITWN